MAKYGGHRKEIAFSKETVKGTATTPASGSWRGHEGFDFKPVVEKVDLTSAFGDVVQLRESSIIREYSQGSVSLKATHEFMGDFANMVMGQAPTTTGAGPYTHTYAGVKNDNEHLTYTVSVADPVEGDLAYAMGMLNSFTLEASQDNYIDLGLEFLAKKEASATLTPSYSTTDTFFKPSAITVKYADNYAGIGAGTTVSLTSLSLNGAKNVNPYFVLGATALNDLNNMRVAFNGQLSLAYSDSTWRDLGLADTTKCIQIAMTSGSYSITITFPEVNFRDWADEGDNDSLLMNSIRFDATGGDATNGLVKIVVVDGTATH